MALKHDWYLYIIRCNNSSLYTGITLDVARRFKEHQEQGRKCAKYLKGKLPIELVYEQKFGSKSLAYKIEKRVKKMSRLNKENLISGILNIKELLYKKCVR